MSITPTDCSLDDRPIQGNDEVICFGAPDYEVQTFGCPIRADHCPGGTLWRSSSKKLKMKENLLPDESSAAAGAFNTPKRLPSGGRSKFTLPRRSVNCPGDQRRGLPGLNDSPETLYGATINYLSAVR